MNFSRFYRLSLPLLLPALLSSTAFAGPGLSGGGKGVVCRDSSGAVQSVELLDLWEAREIHQLPELPMTGDVTAITLAAIKSLSHAIPSDDWSAGSADGHTDIGAPAVETMLYISVKPFLSSYPLAKVRRVKGMRLLPTEDSYEEALPSECNLEQIVRYDDYGNFAGEAILNQDLFDRMNARNQAALYTHEALYKLLRDTSPEASSLRVRRAVGLAFSGHRFTSVDTLHMKSDFYSCQIKPRGSTGGESDSGISQFYVTLRNDNPSQAIVLGAAINGTYTLDAPTEADSEYSWFEVKNFANLTAWAKTVKDHRIFDVTFASTVNPEMKAQMKVEGARPGKLDVSISAPASRFLPQGMPWQRTTCEFHNVK